MFLTLSQAQLARLRAFLEANADCQALSQTEYAADLYDLETPVALDLVFVKGGVRVDGASEMAFDEALEGYYLTAPIADPEQVRDALGRAGAWEEDA